MPTIPSLLGSYIDQTYQRLVQVSGSSFADGLGNPITLAPGSVNPTPTYLPFNNAGTFQDSYLNQSSSILKTTSASIDKGLKLDFNNSIFTLGDYNNSNNQFKIIIDDVSRLISTTDNFGTNGLQIGSGFTNIGQFTGGYTYLGINQGLQTIQTFDTPSTSNGLSLDFINDIYKIGGFNGNNTQIVIDDVAQTITITGSVLLNTITDTPQSNVVTIDTVTGQLYYTASSTFGGGGGGPVDTSGFVTTRSFNNYTGSSTSQFYGTASYALTASLAPNYVLNSVTSSFVKNSQTSSFVLNNQTSSMTVATASYVLGAIYNSSNPALSASYAATASYVVTALTASYITSSNIVGTVTSASYSLSSSYALNSTLPGGANTQIQFNANGAFSGSPNFTYNSGSNTLQLTGSLNITGSTTQVGNNILQGNTTLSGSIIISGSSTPGSPTASVQIYGDIRQTGYHRFDPVSTNINTSTSASYVYVSGSTNDLYFAQNGNGYSNNVRLRWLEGGSLYTGILQGGILSSTPGTTTFKITSGSGLIVTMNASTGSEPYPTAQYISWPEYNTQPITYSGSAKITYVGLDSNGQIIQQTVPWGTNDINQWDNSINLGVVLHLSGSVSTGVFNAPQIAYGPNQKTDDFFRAFGPLKISGHTLQASGSTLGLQKTGGTSYREGANYVINPNHPSTVVENAISTSKIYRYYLSGSTPVIDTGVGNAGYTTIDPTKYVDTTTGQLTTVSGNNSNQWRWTIQRVFWVPNSPTNAFIVYYGNAEYTTLVDVKNAIDTEPFSEAPNTSQNAIFIGYILVRKGCTDLSDTTGTNAVLVQGGLFRNVGGNGGSGTAAATSLGSLSDVSLSNDTPGDLLVYGTAGEWNNKKQLTGSYGLTGSLTVTQNISASSFTGSLFGTATTASYVTASNIVGTVSSASYATTASYVVTALTASYVTSSNIVGTVTSASYAATASYVVTALTASYITSSNIVGTVLSASYAQTASYALATAGGKIISSINTNTTAGSASFTDYIYLVTGSSTVTLTLPTAVNNTNLYTVKNVGTSTASIATTAGQTIDGSSSPIDINVQYVSLTLVSDNANWNII